jgi:diguanylate cyclase (GGDEF)-like protein
MDTPRANEVLVPAEGEVLDILLDLVRDSYAYDFPVSFILLEFDGFDSFTSEHSLLAGELIFAEFGPLLKSYFRASDISLRLAGNKFVVVLGGAPAAVCPRIAETLRLRLEAHAFKASYLPEALRRFTLSIGLATTQDADLPPYQRFDQDSSEGRQRGLKNAWEIASQVLLNASNALQAAQEAGGNCVRLSTAYSVERPAAE